jgi:hypothetical protein
MTFPVSVSKFLALRPRLGDKVLMDYLEVLDLAHNSSLPNLQVSDLAKRWNCSLFVAGMRMQAIIDAGLANIILDSDKDGPGWRITLCKLPPK